MAKLVYVINDHFATWCSGEEELAEFANEHLLGMNVDGFIFNAANDMKPQVIEAVQAAIRSKPDIVVLDVYFGDVGDPSARLGIDIALPMLVETNIPVVVLSALDDNDKIIKNIHDTSIAGNVRYLSSTDIKDLKAFIEASIEISEDDRASVDRGFRYWRASEIKRREKLRSIFEKHSEAVSSEVLELPLIAPANNFLGSHFRPLPEKQSNKLFSSVTTDGRAMTVRYEGTALTAKLVADELKSQPYNKKFNYFQEMVRVEASKDLDAKHFRSFYQAGLEAFTTDKEIHHQNVADVLKFTAKFLRDLGLEPKLRLSHLSILTNVLDVLLAFGKEGNVKVDTKGEEISLDDFAKRRIVGAMEKGSIEDVEETLRVCQVAEPYSSLLIELAKLRDSDLVDGVEFLKAHPDLFGEAHEDLNVVVSKLAESDMLSTCRFDPGIYRSLAFYSGITMQGDVPGMTECLGGGDFAGLVESFGPIGPVYSFGMAVGVERLLALDGLVLE